jgi:hypothetical protein
VTPAPGLNTLVASATHTVTIGASSLSHGLPHRSALNAAFVAMAIASGVTGIHSKRCPAFARQTANWQEHRTLSSWTLARNKCGHLADDQPFASNARDLSH